MRLETSLELLERVRTHLGNVSYYRVAKVLDTDTTTVLRWKAGKAGMGREVALRVAELLEESPEYVIACIESEREPSADVRKVWRRIAEAFRSRAAAIAISLIALPGLGLGAKPAAAQDFAGRWPSADAGPLMHYANRRAARRRRLADRLLGWLLWTPRPAPAWGRV